MREVGPGVVICDKFLSFKRQQRRTPLLQFEIDRALELFVVGLVFGRMQRIDRRKRAHNVLRHRFGNDRVGHEMRIAERMHVAGRARHGAGHVHQTNPLRCDDAAWLAGIEFRVARILQ